MSTTPADLFCSNCGKQIGTQAVCPTCGADNEFLKVPTPDTHTRFDEDALWTPAAIQEALAAQGAIPAPPSSPPAARPARVKPAAPAPAGASPPRADIPVGGETSANDDVEGAPSLFFDFSTPGGDDEEAAAPPAAKAPISTPPAEPPQPAAPPPSSPRPGPDAASAEEEEEAEEGTMILQSPGPAEDGEEDRTFILDEAQGPPIVATLIRLSPPGEGTRYDLHPGTTSVGTKDTDIVLDRTVDKAVSRNHAAIKCESREGKVICGLADVGSSNGTFYQGERIRAPVTLEHDSVIRFGDVEFRFVRRE